MAAIESAKGVLNAKEIALSSKRLIGIALGAEDYVTDLKTFRSPDGVELLFARSMIVNAARAAGIDALDTVYSDINNEEGLIRETTLIRQLGFDGKSVINPRQIGPVHKVFTPTQKDIQKALAIMGAIREANSKGSGVIALNGKMIDKPVVERAQYVIELARAARVPMQEE
jgi:citrate lyase subunit beta/citryl-CoA lyase